MKAGALLVLKTLFVCSAFAQRTDPWLRDLLYSQGSPLLKGVLDSPGVYRYQIIYTRIDRDQRNKPRFKTYYVNEDRNRYFNPASTVKLPAVLIALEKLNELHVDGLDKYTPMFTDSAFSGQTRVLSDSTSATGEPSIAHYIKKIFIVSDNDAYNRLYEWNGQQTMNEKLWKKGYKDVRITRRFVPMTEEENRHTNPVRFVKDGRLIYEQPAVYSRVRFKFGKQVLIGKAHYNRDEVLVNSPMDFTRHNNFPLEDQQLMLRSVLFPEVTGRKRRFNLSADDYSFLYRYLSMLPSESDYPAYDTTEFGKSYAKFFMYTSGNGQLPAGMRIFSKAGWSYGFQTDNAYIINENTGVEFLISATLYVNSDGILNDDKYDYKTIGYPFFKELRDILYKEEQNRKRNYKPDLNKFVANNAGGCD